MNIPKLSVNKPVTITMITFIIIILGFVSFSKLSTDLFPQIDFPMAVVSTNYYGASPEEIEDIVTKNIESTLATVQNVKKITSTSLENNSLVMVQFNEGTDMDAATLELREKVDLVTTYLPEEVTDPMIMKINPDMMPIMGFSVTYKGKDMSEVTSWVDTYLVPRLERIEGVASVSKTGGTTKEVKITIDTELATAKGIKSDMVINMLKAQNINMPSGNFSENNVDYSIRVIGEFETLDDIKKLPLATPQGNILLKDIATIEITNEAKKTYSKVNGEDSIMINIQRQNNYNITDVAKKINKELDTIKKDVKGTTFLTVFDQSEYINQSVSSVSNNALIGAILAIFILLIFLKDLRPTIVIGVAIPISIITAFILIYFFGITLNIVSLGGLALGIGMLVDNAIVVLENIYRLRKEGKSRKDAAIEGTKQVGTAIVASTLTTISVFLPVVFIQGTTAQIFKEMALTVTSSLLASLIIALTLVPMMSSKLIKKPNQSKHHKIMDATSKVYRKLLKSSLNHRWIIILLIIMIVVGSGYGYSAIGFEFFPESDEGQITVTAQMPKGTSFNDTVKEVSNMEQLLKDIKEIDVVSASVTGNPDIMTMMMAASSDQGTLNILLKEPEDREKTTKEMADIIRKKLESKTKAELKIEAVSSTMGPTSSAAPVSVEITGYELEKLSEISKDVAKILKDIDGTVEIDTGIEKGAPELNIALDRAKATSFGLTTAQIGEHIKNTVSGVNATKFKVEGKELDVVVQEKEYKDMTIEKLENIPILSPMGTPSKLKDVSKIEKNIGYSQINRSSGTRIMTVSSQLKEGANLRTVNEAIKKALDKYDMPNGYNYKITGQNEQIEESFFDLGLALILGVVLIYMIMAAQFESFIYPFIIMFSVPLAFTGGFGGLLLTGNSLSIVAILGMIILAGIVVNNGIVLVDYINQLKSQGKSTKEAILEAGSVRLRPILMTALTTILALVPLALGMGEGAEMEQPMAVTVISGLVTSTLLTLIVIPVIYSYVDSIKTFFTRKKKKLAE